MGSEDGTSNRSEPEHNLQHLPPPSQLPPVSSLPIPSPSPEPPDTKMLALKVSAAGEQPSEVNADGATCLLTGRRKSVNCGRSKRVHFGASNEAPGAEGDGDVHIEVIEIPNRFEEDRSPSYCPAVDFYWQHPGELESPANDEFELNGLPGAMLELPARSYTAGAARLRRPRRRRLTFDESAASATFLQSRRPIQIHSAFVPSRSRRASQMPADIEYLHRRLLMTAALKPQSPRRLSADFLASDVLQVKKLEGTQRVLARGMQKSAPEEETAEESSQQQLLIPASKQKLKQKGLSKGLLDMDKKGLTRAVHLQAAAAASRSARSAEVLSLRAAQSKAATGQPGSVRDALAPEERTPRIELVSYLTATISAKQTTSAQPGRTQPAPNSPQPPGANPVTPTPQIAPPTAATNTVPAASMPLTPRMRLTLALQSAAPAPATSAAPHVRMQTRSAWDPRAQPHTIEIAQLWS